MAIIDGNEYDLMQLWSLITQLSDQLNKNRSLSVSLYALSGNIKVNAVHSKAGFVLRSLNADIPTERYEAELERMNSSMVIENQALQQDNKQLNALIKEYEQTLETLMSTFRNRARDVQERELSLIREYEAKLLDREETNATEELIASTTVSQSISRLSHFLRQLLRAECGDEADDPLSCSEDSDELHHSFATSGLTDHALEREIELARLRKENEDLKQLMGSLPVMGRYTDPRKSPLPPQPPSTIYQNSVSTVRSEGQFLA